MLLVYVKYDLYRNNNNNNNTNLKPKRIENWIVENSVFFWSNSIPKFNHFFLRSGPTHIARFNTMRSVVFAVITNIDRQTDRQTTWLESTWVKQNKQVYAVRLYTAIQVETHGMVINCLCRGGIKFMIVCPFVFYKDYTNTIGWFFMKKKIGRWISVQLRSQ